MRAIRALTVLLVPALFGLACSADDGGDSSNAGGYGAVGYGGTGGSTSGGSSSGGSPSGGFGGTVQGGSGGSLTGGTSGTGGVTGGSGGASGAGATGGSSGAAGSGGGTGGSSGGAGGSGGATGGSGGSGGSSTNDCCSAAKTPGCATPSIQSCVCTQDNFCCSTAWDSMCVQEVDAFTCGNCGTGGTGGTGGAGGTGGTTAGCTGTTAFECGNTSNRCSGGNCYKCSSGLQNCNGIGGCECSGTCNGSSCSTCTDAGPEPNNTVAQATSACPTVLCNISDCNFAGSSVSGVVKPGGDVDFFKFKGLDDICVVDPTVSTTTTGIQACVFAICNDNSAAFQSCKQGTQATEGGMTGCCTSTAGTAQLEINCPGINDSATVYIRVKGSNPNSCTPYDVSYHF